MDDLQVTIDGVPRPDLKIACQTRDGRGNLTKVDLATCPGKLCNCWPCRKARGGTEVY